MGTLDQDFSLSYDGNTSDKSIGVDSGDCNIGINNSGSGAIWIAPNTTTPAPNNNPWNPPKNSPYIAPYQPQQNNPYIYTTTSGTSINIKSGTDKYAVMKLERNDLPTHVFVSGRLVTMGLLGTDVEVAFVGDQLVFSPGVINSISYEGRVTLSVEYKDEIQHYNIGRDGEIWFIDDSLEIDAVLLSKVAK